MCWGAFGFGTRSLLRFVGLRAASERFSGSRRIVSVEVWWRDGRKDVKVQGGVVVEVLKLVCVIVWRLEGEKDCLQKFFWFLGCV